MSYLKRIILALALVALVASVALGAYTSRGYKEFTADGSVTITGRPASNISVYATHECTFGITNHPQDEGWPVTVRAGSTVTMSGLDLYSFTIDWTEGTVDVYWW